MNSVKITYIVATLIFQLAMIGLAVAAPIWITPDSHFWSCFGVAIFFLSGVGFTQRVNSWKDFGAID